MKQKLLCLLISISSFLSACSKEQVKGVLDDISRDTYENNARKQHHEHLGDPAYIAPPTYDQYQRERKQYINTRKASTEANNDE